MTADEARHPYATAAYAAALAQSQGWQAADAREWSTAMTLRPIAGGGFDAAGPYPRTAIAADADLDAGLERLRGLGLVSAVLVPDPLAAPDPARLAAAFPLCRPFKTHLLVERAKGYEPTKHHRDRIRRALRRCEVRVVSLAAELDAWRGLYAELIARHGVTGVAAFPDPYFPALAGMDAFAAFAAFVDGAIVGMTIWFEHAGVAVSHLTATNAAGYANGANYALNDAAIAHFAGAAVVDLGGGAGLADDPDDGLAQFKRGFANAEIVAQLCGAVLDAARYAALTAGRPPTGFFPAYRA
jgi:hypothetical protein